MADYAVMPNLCACLNLAIVPDLRAFADFGALGYKTGFVGEEFNHMLIDSYGLKQMQTDAHRSAIDYSDEKKDDDDKNRLPRPSASSGLAMTGDMEN